MSRSELKAILVSAVASSAFLFCFAFLFHKPVPPEPQLQSVIACGPSPDIPPLQPPDQNGRFRRVPEGFKLVDFNNWSYGYYRYGRKKFILDLTQGQHSYSSKEGGGETFSLNDVLYTDLTGDQKPEAIVMLSHVDCAVSCDGSSDLFYVYESGKTGLREIWEYETGSRAYGCGLKSLTLSKKDIVLEMFGRCWEPASSDPGPAKFMINGKTRAVFQFNGSRFVRRHAEVTDTPAIDVKNYEAPIRVL